MRPDLASPSKRSGPGMPAVGRRQRPLFERAKKLKARRPASGRLSLDAEVQLDCHKDVDWHVSDMAGCKSPLPNGRDCFLVEPAWIE